MIPITPEIIGPGIEEEYQDALIRINQLLEILKDYPYDNDTDEGRNKLELFWLRQEIMAGRLPMPPHRSLWATLAYTVGDGSLDRLPGFDKVSGELYAIFTYGLVKPRHYPVVMAMMDEVMRRIHKPGNQPLMALERELINLKVMLSLNQIDLPVPERDWPAIAKMSGMSELGYGESKQMLINLSCTLIDGWRPDPCSKGPLAPPNPEPLRRELQSAPR
jgi:hypothetical protein